MWFGKATKGDSPIKVEIAVDILEEELGWHLVEEEIDVVKTWIRNGGASGPRGKKREREEDIMRSAL
eukprot:51348-Eustigmatos_ZCMA.PRE.1